MKLKYFIPISISIIYLLFTQWIFAYGPIEYGLKQPMIFWILLFCYNFCIVIGYFAGYRYSKIRIQSKYRNLESTLDMRYVHLVIIGSFIASLISFKGGENLIERLNPIFWFESAIKGILNPGEAYNDKMSRVISDTSGNKVFNIILFMIAFTKSLVIPFTIFFWKKLSKSFRLIAVLASILPLLSSLSNGTNKGVFDFAIFLSTAIILKNIYNSQKQRNIKKNSPFKLIIISLSIISISVIYFSNTIGQRGGDIQFIESQDTLGRINVKEKAVNLAQSSPSFYTYAWLGSYIVQGYYGFSLALEEDFDSTFGFGNSIFVRRNIESITGLKLRERTFQYKVREKWGEYSQWHSFYSYFANDFHFIGVGFILFILGMNMFSCWNNFLHTANPFAGALMSIYALLIIFLPANNQIFGFLDGFSGFFWTTLLWIKTKKLNND